MLKYLNRATSFHWMLIGVALFFLFSFAKVLAGFVVIVAGIGVLVRFWSDINSGFNKLFGKIEEK